MTSTFRAISNFVHSLSSVCRNYKPLKNYQNLISQTHSENPAHQNAIAKHNAAFTSFCENNVVAILNRDYTALKNCKVAYSAKVYIEIDTILNSVGEENKNGVWKHLLCITALTCPDTSDSVKSALQEIAREEELAIVVATPAAAATTTASDEEIADLTNRLFSVFDRDAVDPMAILPIVMGEMKNGMIDLPKMLKSTKLLFKKLDEKVEDVPENGQKRTMIATIVNLLDDFEQGKTPNISSLLELYMTIMKDSSAGAGAGDIGGNGMMNVMSMMMQSSASGDNGAGMSGMMNMMSMMMQPTHSNGMSGILSMLSQNPPSGPSSLSLGPSGRSPPPN